MIIQLKNKIKYLSGMTLIELMVVIAIFTMITTITIFDYGSFNSSVSIQNLSDDIALSIRKAQSYAIGTQQANNKFTAGYGIHFTAKDPSVSGNNKELAGSNRNFIIYTDFNAPGGYVYSNSQNATCGTPDINNECSEILSLNGTNKIKSIVMYFSNSVTPVTLGAGNNDGSLDIMFHRPNPDAKFCYKEHNTSTSSCSSDSGYISNVDIVVSNGLDYAKEKTKTITVYNTGQINLQ